MSTHIPFQNQSHRQLSFNLCSSEPSTMTSPPLTLSPSEQERLIDKLQVFKIQGRDKRGCKLLRIIGKLFPGN